MKIIVLGKNGMLGSYVFKYFTMRGFEVIGSDRSTLDVSIDNMAIVRKTLDGLIDVKSYVINCIGKTNHNKNQVDDMLLVNSYFPLLLSDICTENGAFLIHPTTDCVYDGKDGGYDNNSDITPNDDYGMSKYLGEICARTSMVIRTSIIGEDKNKRSLLEWAKQNKDQTVYGYTNHWWNGVTCLEWAKQIEHILVSGLYKTGIQFWHSLTYDGHDKINKAGLLHFINKVYKLNLTIIPKETETSVCRHLYGRCVEKSIEKQLDEMYDFKIIN